MFKLKKKRVRKGFILIEILCAMTIFTMLLTSSIGVFYQSRKIKKVKNENLKHFTFAECLKNNMMYNITYEDLSNLKKNNRVYIDEEDMDLDNLKNGKILDVFKDNFETDNSYIKVDITEDIKDENIFKINMRLHCNNKKKSKVICCEFYKGRYKR